MRKENNSCKNSWSRTAMNIKRPRPYFFCILQLIYCFCICLYKVVYINVASGTSRSSRPQVLCKKMFWNISQNSQENTSDKVSFFNKVVQALDLWHNCGTGVFLRIFKDTFFYRAPLVGASENRKYFSNVLNCWITKL